MRHAHAIIPLVVSMPYMISLMSGKWDFLHIWDDNGNFLENEMIQGLGTSNLISMFLEVRINVYEPFSWILKALTVSIFGLSSFHIRVVTLIFHVANTMLVYSLTRSLLPEATNDLARIATALLWGLHPVQAEVVGWPSAQPYALSVFFALLSVKAYVENKSHWISTVLYVASVMSKSASIFLPVCFVCIDFAKSDTALTFIDTAKTLIHRWTLKCPHFYVCGALVGLTMWANHHGMQLDADTYTLTHEERIGRVILSYSQSILRILWPVDLRPHYRLKIRDVQLDSSHIILASTTLICFVLYSIVKWQRRRGIIATAVLCVATLAPVSGIINHGMVMISADRYCYFLSLWIVPALTAWLSSSSSSTDEKSNKNNNMNLHITIALIISAAFATLSYHQFEIWRNPESFFEASLSIDEADWRLLDIKSEHLLRQDRRDEAFKLMDVAIAHSPKNGIKALLNIGKFHVIRDEIQLACAAYVNAYHSVTSTGGQPTGALHNNLGVCSLYVDAFQEAHYHFQKGLEIGAVLPRHMEILEMNLVEFRKWDGVSAYRGGHQLIF